MKKNFITLCVLIAIGIQFNQSKTIAQVEVSYSFEQLNQIVLREASDQLCFVTTCTRTPGSDCDYPGAAYQECMPW